MKKIDIRLANSNDAQIIALLGRITFAETFGHFFSHQQDLQSYFDATFSVDKIKSSLDKPNNVYWISFVDQLPVGYGKLKLNSRSEFIDSDNICQLQKIYVLKDFLGMKIGYQLQNMLLQKANDLGFGIIWLSVLNSNERAINFYKKNGFDLIGSHDFTIGKEDFEFSAMGKEL